MALLLAMIKGLKSKTANLAEGLLLL